MRSWFAQARSWFARSRAFATAAGRDRQTHPVLARRAADAIAPTPPACGRFRCGSRRALVAWLSLIDRTFVNLPGPLVVNYRFRFDDLHKKLRPCFWQLLVNSCAFPQVTNCVRWQALYLVLASADDADWRACSHARKKFRCVFDEFGHDDFSWHEVLKFLEHHPAWDEINRHMDQRKV